MIQYIGTVDRVKGFADITYATKPGATPHRIAYLRDAGPGTNNGWWCERCGTRCHFIGQAQQITHGIDEAQT